MADDPLHGVLAHRLPEVDLFVGPDAYRPLCPPPPRYVLRALRPQQATAADSETYADIRMRVRG